MVVRSSYSFLMMPLSSLALSRMSLSLRAVDSNPSAWVCVRAGGGVIGGLGSPIAVRRPLFCELGAGLARPGTEGSSRCARPLPLYHGPPCMLGSRGAKEPAGLSADGHPVGQEAGRGGACPSVACVAFSSVCPCRCVGVAPVQDGTAVLAPSPGLVCSSLTLFQPRF